MREECAPGAQGLGRQLAREHPWTPYRSGFPIQAWPRPPGLLKELGLSNETGHVKNRLYRPELLFNPLKSAGYRCAA